jgi:hypothetical protein
MRELNLLSKNRIDVQLDVPAFQSLLSKSAMGSCERAQANVDNENGENGRYMLCSESALHDPTPSRPAPLARLNGSLSSSRLTCDCMRTISSHLTPIYTSL